MIYKLYQIVSFILIQNFSLILCQATQVNNLSSLCEEVTQPSLVSGTLFAQHKLPKDYDELGSALTAHLIARKMLDEGKGIEALSYAYKAEQFYVPGSLRLLWDVAQGRYVSIPKNIQQEIREKLPDVKKFRDLLKSYEKMFCTNRHNLLEKENESFSTKVFHTFFTSKAKKEPSKIILESTSYEDDLQNQETSLNQHQEVKIPLLKDDKDEIKKNS